MQIALAQINPTVGAIDRNAAAVLAAWQEAAAAGADLVLFPELVLVGYPPGDLILDPEVVRANESALADLARRGPDGTTAVVGFVAEISAVAAAGGDWDVSVPAREDLRNAAAVLAGGGIVATYHKARLPTYGPFDDARWFTPGREPCVVDVAGTPLGVTVCEDLWSSPGPVDAAVGAGATVVANINASPYHRGKRDQRLGWIRRHAVDQGVWLAYVNAVGGQDGIVFDGDSLVCRPDGEIVACGAQFAEDLLIVDIDPAGGGWPAGDQPDGSSPGTSPPRPGGTAEVWEALVIGTRDYCHKNGFERAAVGLSGGIDSSLTAAIAVDALGGGNVLGVRMPSPYTSEASLEDAAELARNLGMETVTIPITAAMEAFEAVLAEPFAGRERDETEENVQARIRGIILMAISNKLGHLILATGNKSEASVGYATLYGDMVGGFAPILDVYKQLVYELARHRNERGPAIPQRTLERPPSAELAPGQADEDALPPYAALDDILRHYVDERHGVEEIVAAGHDEETVREVLRMVDAAEFKRKQAAPAVKISESAFEKDRRMPITNSWRH